MKKTFFAIAMLIGIFIAGNLLASEDTVGLYLTVMTATNPEPYPNQWVTATINGVTQRNDTHSSGLVKFGWLGASGIYYIETEIDGEIYSTTVEKEAGVAAFRTWYIQEIEHDLE